MTRQQRTLEKPVLRPEPKKEVAGGNDVGGKEQGSVVGGGERATR